MRVLLSTLGSGSPRPEDGVSDADLARLYAAPAPDWLRCNMVSSLDGSATGADGLTGSVNNPADKRVFDCLRRLADAVVVGAGTARAEGYRPTSRPTVVVSRRAAVPPGLRDAPSGSVLLVTCAGGDGLGQARATLGDDGVLVLGDDAVDLVALRPALAERGLRQVLCEGGPHLLRELLAAGAVDEMCTTLVPLAVGGDGPRIVSGAPLGTAGGLPLDLRLMLEEDGTLLGRWFLGSPDRADRPARGQPFG